MTRAACALAAGLALAGLAACAVNPATGKRQLSFVGEGQEVEIGREQDKLVVEQIGLYGGPELQDYIQRVGKRLADESERPELPWTFRVVDDASVNAFALPGGFIYVTRGMMTHLTNEAELAGVLGHEIGHVTARHSVNQMSKAQLATLGLGIGSIVSEEVAGVSGLLQTGLGLLFLKYSRDDERQADDLGLRYVLRKDYDPREVPDVFGMLDRLGEASGGGGTPGWLSTHPQPENRQQHLEEAVAALERGELEDRVVGQDEYYRLIDEMVFGDDPREGYFRGKRFLHPELRFSLTFPEDWQTANQKSAVLGVSKDQDAAIELTLTKAESASAALQEFLKQSGVQPEGSGPDRINGLPAASRGFSAQAKGGNVRGLVAFVEHADRVFRLVGYSTAAAWDARKGELQRSLESFDRVSDSKDLDVEPKRVQIVDLDREQSLEGFAKAHDATVDVQTLALINQVDPDSRLKPGRPYKVVTGGATG